MLFRTLLMLIAVTFLTPRLATANDAATSTTLGKWQQHYVDRVAKFQAENAALAPDAKTIVFVGDSLTEGMPTATLFPGLPVLNRGIGSDGTADYPNGKALHRGLINRFGPSIGDCRPRIVFILIGTNDVGNKGVPLEYWLGNLETILDRVAKELPDCRVVLHTLPPSGPPYARVESLNAKAREYNDMLRALAERRGLPLIDLWELYASPEGILPPEVTGDGLHIRKAAYERWAAKARELIAEAPTSAPSGKP